MRLHLTEDTGEVLNCPKCERELWPAYWTEGGLEVCYWADSTPPDGLDGLLVCGNLECDYEEPVTFTKSPIDAVPWNYEFTFIELYDHGYMGLPQSWLLEWIEYIEELQAETGQPKLASALAFCRQEVEERQEQIERWFSEATAKGHPVSLRAEEEELTGAICGSDGDHVWLQTPDGEVREVPKAAIWKMRIQYPRRQRMRRKRLVPEGVQLLFPLSDSRWMVVEGHHLRYGGRTEMGGYYLGRCWDPAVAAALRLREEAPGYWEGAFRAEEIDRFYYREDLVRVGGYWLEELSRNEQHGVVWVKTEDPAIAEALAMEPQFHSEAGEFGSWDGEECFGYWGQIRVAEIEESRWQERPEPLPVDPW